MPASARWSRDELILVLDLYFDMDYARDASDGDERVASLARTLNSLPLRNDELSQPRNVREVSLILSDYLRFDPEHAVMQARIGETAERVWESFAGDREKLQQTAESIRRNADVVPMRGSDLEDEIEFDEGRILTRIHFARERNATLVTTKKRLVLTQTGKLECEACGFDFQKVYGELGEGYAECHHTAPVATLNPGTNTRLTDLCILCSNCHRMIHHLMARNSTFTTPAHLQRYMD
jgi:5-methylcytosine-specific restriction enzyme A